MNACRISRQLMNPWKAFVVVSSTGADRMPCLASTRMASPIVVVLGRVTTVLGGLVSRKRRSDHPNSSLLAWSRSGGAGIVVVKVVVGVVFAVVVWTDEPLVASPTGSYVDPDVRLAITSVMSHSSRLPRRMSPIARLERGMYGLRERLWRTSVVA